MINSDEPIVILSLYWGYSIGGVGKYGSLIDKVSDYRNVVVKHVCILNEAWQCDKNTLNQIDAEVVKIKSRLDFSWLSYLKGVFGRVDPDAIITHGFNGHGAILLSRILNHHKLPMLVSYHGLYHGTTGLRKLISPVFNALTEAHIKYSSSAVVSVSEYSKKYLLLKGVKEEKISVIHNGIRNIECDQSADTLLRKEWGVASNEILVGVASRIDPVKGLSYLIEALPNLVRKNKDVKLAIVGTGTEEESLKSRVKQLGVADKIVFTGFRSDIQDCLQAFDVFVLPSLAEYHSIGLLEAMRAGKKIVATDVGGNTESVRHLREGYIVKSKNSSQLENAISYLIDNEENAEQMASNARNRFEKEFLEELMISKTANWFVTSIRQERPVL